MRVSFPNWVNSFKKKKPAFTVIPIIKRRGESPLVEVQFEPIEGQEYPDIRDRYDKMTASGVFKE